MTKHLAGFILFSFIVSTAVVTNFAVSYAMDSISSPSSVEVNYERVEKRKKRKKRKKRRCRRKHGHQSYEFRYEIRENVRKEIKEAVERKHYKKKDAGAL